MTSTKAEPVRSISTASSIIKQTLAQLDSDEFTSSYDHVQQNAFGLGSEYILLDSVKKPLFYN